MLQKNYERKEISMQNDEHGPVDSSLFCWLFLCNSVFSLFHSLSPAHLSPLSISLYSSISVSLCLCLSLSLSLASLPSPAPAAFPSQARSEVAAPPPGSPPLGCAPCTLGLRRPDRPAPPRSCSLGSGDAPCMSPHPWIVMTRNNRNKVNKSENK